MSLNPIICNYKHLRRLDLELLTSRTMKDKSVVYAPLTPKTLTHDPGWSPTEHHGPGCPGPFFRNVWEGTFGDVAEMLRHLDVT